MRGIRNVRDTKGTVLAELAIGCMFTVTLALFALDLGSAMICYGVNDRACRDAARAAAQGSTAAEAANLANQIVKSFKPASGLVSTPQVVNVVYNDFNGAPPDGSSPYVSVTTRATAHAIAPLSMFGHAVASGAFPIAKTYTFPIIKLTVKSP